jgi:hypothetical protein
VVILPEKPKTPSELARAVSNQEKEQQQVSYPEVVKGLKKKYEDDLLPVQSEAQEGGPSSRVKPYESEEWRSPWGINYSFIMPPATVYRRIVRNRKVAISEDNSITFDPSVVEPLFEDFVSPRPNDKELTPGQWEQLCINYWGFLRRQV